MSNSISNNDLNRVRAEATRQSAQLYEGGEITKRSLERFLTRMNLYHIWKRIEDAWQWLKGIIENWLEGL